MKLGMKTDTELLPEAVEQICLLYGVLSYVRTLSHQENQDKWRNLNAAIDRALEAAREFGKQL
jgi:hypothetical protein